MIINRVNKSKQGKLFKTIYGYSQSFIKRGVSLNITAHSEYVANIILRVNGLNGTAEKNIIIVYDNAEHEWVAYCDGISYRLVMLSDISIVIKNRINKLSTLVSKI
jgi:hypothetical protein